MFHRILVAALVATHGANANLRYSQPVQVQEDVESMLNEFQEYTKFHGPSPTFWNYPHRTSILSTATPSPSNQCSYWLENVRHQGLAAFNPDRASYQVFRNVKDYGAKGDGIADDTAAINLAISSGGRCAPGTCSSTTITPAIVYFPFGVYMINSSIIDYYYTQIIGNPNCLPTIKAFDTFAGGFGLIDGDPYQAGGVLAYGATNVFWRQCRNLIIDMTLIPYNSPATGIHWPTAQATSLQNIVFRMSDALGTQHQGVFIESGSGGFMNDLVFYGGLNAVVFGNQQFTMRNLTFNNAVTAIFQIWDWGWTYKNININNCSVGLNMSSGGHDAQSVGSVTFLDSSITNTGIGIITAHDATSQPPTAGSLIIENLATSNVPVIVQDAGQNVLSGSAGQTNVAAFGQGHSYTPSGPVVFEGQIPPNARPAGLTSAGDKFYERSKPQYETYPVSSFLSARTLGAKGDGQTDDSQALQAAIFAARAQNKILFVDHGDYIVTRTLYVPAGSRIVGEAYSVFLSRGAYFNDINSPRPVVQLGWAGERGSIEWSDMIVSTQGQQQGAVLIEYNLVSPSSSPSGLWDVHARIGGFAGSDLQLAQCPTTPNVTVTATNLVQECIAAYLTLHLTKQSSGLYAENVWLWVADHDVEDPNLTQITIYAGRGLLVESQAGNNWLVGTAVEHHVKYQYQFSNTRNIFAGQIQTETPYYQPNPSAPLPFPYVAALNDPAFPAASTANGSIPNADAWGLRIVNSEAILVYGAGLYSFFDNYSTQCSNQGNGEVCQDHIFSIEQSSGAGDVSVYNLNTVGTHNMIAINGRDTASYADNLDGFIDTIALIRT